ncbi:hypothetical protein [Belnapia rosea]|nr:hypothetical protein [Belnapia rosea]
MDLEEIQKLVRNWQRRVENLQKGEFETTEAFNERKRSLNSAPLAPGLDRDATFVFRINGPRYDADRRAFDFPNWSPVAEKERDSSEPAIRLNGRQYTTISYFDWQKTTRESFYVGQNFLGTEVLIRRTEENILSILVCVARDKSDADRERMDRQYFSRPWTGLGPVRPPCKTHKTPPVVIDLNRAMQLAAGLRFLIFCKLDLEIGVIQGPSRSYRPSLNHPHEFVSTSILLAVVPTHILLYHQPSGEVLGRATLNADAAQPRARTRNRPH